jgi:hypothetical protein
MIHSDVERVKVFIGDVDDMNLVLFWKKQAADADR